jgi:hypothetical protein
LPSGVIYMRGDDNTPKLVSLNAAVRMIAQAYVDRYERKKNKV